MIELDPAATLAVSGQMCLDGTEVVVEGAGTHSAVARGESEEATAADG